MKVALLIERFVPGAGGAESYARDLARFLGSQGHEVDVLCLRAQDPPPAVRVRKLAVPALPFGLTVWLYARAAGRAADRGGYDVVHALMKACGANLFHPHTGSHLASVRAALRASPAGPVRSLRRLLKALSPKQALFRSIERRQYAARPLLVAVSRRVARDMERLHDAPPDRIRLLPNGVDRARFAPGPPDSGQAFRSAAGASDGDLLLLFAAHHFRLKGLATLLRSLPLLPAPLRHRTRLAVAGRDRPGRYRRLARRLGVEALVRFLGPVDDMPAAYRGADLFCLPTFYDPCSLTVLEAMASATPVLTTPANGASELFADRPAWILPDPADASGLAERIAALADPDVRREAGEELRRRTAAVDREEHFRRLLALYDEAASLGQAAG